MTVRLICHTDESASGGTSPFDEVLTNMISGQDIWIACPYLDVEFIDNYTIQSRSWRLITDAQAWVKSYLSDSVQIQSFIEKYVNNIHHCPHLHAKVVITRTTAFLGSANLTQSGILHNQEVSVLFENDPIVEALYTWFQGVWSQTAPVDINELNLRIQEMRQVWQAQPVPAYKPRALLSSPAPQIRSKRVDDVQKQNNVDTTQLDLTSAIQSTPAPIARKRRGRNRSPIESPRRCSVCKLAAGEVYPEGHERAGQVVKFWGNDYYCTYHKRLSQRKAIEKNPEFKSSLYEKQAEYLKERPQIADRAQKKYLKGLRDKTAERRASERPEGDVLDLQEAADVLGLTRQGLHWLVTQHDPNALPAIEGRQGERLKLWFRRADVEHLKAVREQKHEQQGDDQQDGIL